MTFFISICYYTLSLLSLTPLSSSISLTWLFLPLPHPSNRPPLCLQEHSVLIHKNYFLFTTKVEYFGSLSSSVSSLFLLFLLLENRVSFSKAALQSWKIFIQLIVPSQNLFLHSFIAWHVFFLSDYMPFIR